MFEFLTPNPAVALLKADHDRVKELFDRFEVARTRPAKLKIVRAALVELKVHAAIEEELFYPAVRKPVGKEIMNEADEEHHVAKLLIAELDAMDGSESHFDAKFRVLAENVRHHIEEAVLAGILCKQTNSGGPKSVHLIGSVANPPHASASPSA